MDVLFRNTKHNFIHSYLHHHHHNVMRVQRNPCLQQFALRFNGHRNKLQWWHLWVFTAARKNMVLPKDINCFQLAVDSDKGSNQRWRMYETRVTPCQWRKHISYPGRVLWEREKNVLCLRPKIYKTKAIWMHQSMLISSCRSTFPLQLPM